MSLEDKAAAGAAQRSVLDNGIATTTTTWVTGPSPLRRSITFSTSDTPNFTVANKPVTTVVAGMGFNKSSGPLEFTVEKHGEIVRQAWWILGDNVTSRFGWVETFD